MSATRGKRTLTLSGGTAEGPQRRGPLSWVSFNTEAFRGGSRGCSQGPPRGRPSILKLCVFLGALRSTEWPDHGTRAGRGRREGEGEQEQEVAQEGQ